jgi:upstream activation factor subunit UAF30
VRFGIQPLHQPIPSTIMSTDANDDEPSADVLRTAIRTLLAKSDLTKMTNKRVRKQLEAQFKCKFKPRKAEINGYIADAVAEIAPPPPPPPPTPTSGFMAPLRLSPPLATFLGKPTMARPHIVKRMWSHIHARKLQKPENGREILCDDTLRAVFKRDHMTMFSMNTYIARHVKPIDDLAPFALDTIGDSDADDEATVQKRASKKKAAAEKRAQGKKRKAEGIVTISGFAKPVPLSSALAAFVKQPEMSRTHVVKALWEHVKANNLQDPTDRRFILCDDALKRIFDGKERVSGFGMNKLLSIHFHKTISTSTPTTEAEETETEAATTRKTKVKALPSPSKLTTKRRKIGV